MPVTNYFMKLFSAPRLGPGYGLCYITTKWPWVGCQSAHDLISVERSTLLCPGEGWVSWTRVWCISDATRVMMMLIIESATFKKGSTKCAWPLTTRIAPPPSSIKSQHRTLKQVHIPFKIKNFRYFSLLYLLYLLSLNINSFKRLYCYYAFLFLCLHFWMNMFICSIQIQLNLTIFLCCLG